MALEATNLGKAKSLFKKELEWMRKQPKARTTKSKSRTHDFYQIKEKSEKKQTKEVKKIATKNIVSYNKKREFGALESEIEKLQKIKLRIENQFLNVEIEPDDIAKKSEELQNTIDNLEQKEERWLELSMKLEG